MDDDRILNLSEKDLIYIAGFVDGEGCFCVGKPKRRGKRHFKKPDSEFYYYPYFCVYNTDEQIIRWLVKVIPFLSFGDCPPRKLGYKPQYRASSSNRDNIKALFPGLIPHLKIKKRQAELLLELCDRDPSDGKDIYKEVCKLNQLGDPERRLERITLTDYVVRQLSLKDF